jgi:glutamate racemase
MLPRIGVFDSGVGGLTVLRAIAGTLPAQYLYFGDTARLPYGTKSAATVARYASAAARYLQAQQIDLLVVACNSATALALPEIQQAVPLPVIGVVEPGAEMASEVSVARSAIVIATEATVSSHAYSHALERQGMKAHEKACPLFVPLVEEGWIEHPVTEQVAKIYLAEAMAASGNSDVLLLGCTHYPLLAPLLRRIAPPEMKMVDSAESTARSVQRVLATLPVATQSQPSSQHDHRSFHFFVTDSVDKFKRLATRFLGRQVDRVEHIDLGG